MKSRDEIATMVVEVVADALGQKAADVHLHSSLIDDLGAESIDFLDIVFRLETAFGFKIPSDEVWQGAFGRKATDAASIDEIVRGLKERMPEFPWDRFRNGVTRTDLPRLITVRTIVDYLEQRCAQQAPS